MALELHALQQKDRDPKGRSSEKDSGYMRQEAIVSGNEIAVPQKRMVFPKSKEGTNPLGMTEQDMEEIVELAKQAGDQIVLLLTLNGVTCGELLRAPTFSIQSTPNNTVSWSTPVDGHELTQITGTGSTFASTQHTDIIYPTGDRLSAAFPDEMVHTNIGSLSWRTKSTKKIKDDDRVNRTYLESLRDYRGELLSAVAKALTNRPPMAGVPEKKALEKLLKGSRIDVLRAELRSTIIERVRVAPFEIFNFQGK